MLHDDRFPQDAADEEWLPVVGQQGWILLTKDERLRRDSVQRSLLLAAGVRAFVLSDANLDGATMAAAYVRALPRMRRIARAHHGALIASVSPLGGIKVLAISA